MLAIDGSLDLGMIRTIRGCHAALPRFAEPLCGLAWTLRCLSAGTVRIWDVPSWQSLATIVAHGGEYIYSIAAVPTEGHDFVTGGEDGTVAVWKDGQVAQQITMPAKTVWWVLPAPPLPPPATS